MQGRLPSREAALARGKLGVGFNMEKSPTHLQGVFVRSSQRPPRLLTDERIGEVQNPPFLEIDNVLPVAYAMRCAGQSLNNLSADPRPAGRGRFSQRLLDVVHAADPVLQHPGEVERLKYALGTELAKACVDFEKSLPGTQEG